MAHMQNFGYHGSSLSQWETLKTAFYATRSMCQKYDGLKETVLLSIYSQTVSKCSSRLNVICYFKTIKSLNVQRWADHLHSNLKKFSLWVVYLHN